MVGRLLRQRHTIHRNPPRTPKAFAQASAALTIRLQRYDIHLTYAREWEIIFTWEANISLIVTVLQRYSKNFPYPHTLKNSLYLYKYKYKSNLLPIGGSANFTVTL